MISGFCYCIVIEERFGVNDMKRILCAVLALVILLTVSSCKLYTPKQYADGEANAKLIVHFIDVGQGDSILLESDDEFVLIDAGERGSGDTVSSYINERGADELKYVIATHPHTDQMGTIIAYTDGTGLSFSAANNNLPTEINKEDKDNTTAKAADPQETSYIGNKNSHVFHTPDCSGVKNMNEKNKVTFESREAAVEAGYKPCSSCNP